MDGEDGHRAGTSAVEVRDPRGLGRCVRQVRKAKGLTQVELAGVAGVGVRFPSEMERGKASSHLGKVMRVLHRLGCRLRIEARLREADREA
jgi:y4mF family transcriptional regulator